MKKARFTEEQIIGILREQEVGAKRPLCAAIQDQQRHVLQLENQVAASKCLMLWCHNRTPLHGDRG